MIPRLYGLVFLLSLCGFLASPAYAVQGFVSGQLITSWCWSDEALDKEACLSYLRGVFDTLQAVEDESGREQGRLLCVPRSTPITRLRAIVKRRAREVPPKPSQQGSSYLIAAWRDVFPCK